MHDLSSSKSRSSLIKWATELTGDTSFIAPYPNQVADRNIGGLPVPVLVIGNKSDLSVQDAGVQKSWCRCADNRRFLLLRLNEPFVFF